MADKRASSMLFKDLSFYERKIASIEKPYIDMEKNN